MNSWVRRKKYQGKSSHVAKVHAERRSAIRLAFGKANLFPLPKRFSDSFNDWSWPRVNNRIGRNPRTGRLTRHLRKKDALRLLRRDIVNEAAILMDIPRANIYAVIWRHTGGYGNFAKHFLVEVVEPIGLDASGASLHRTRLMLRTRMPVKVQLANGRVKYRGRYIVLCNEQEDLTKCIWSLEQGKNDMLAHLPSHLFESAVDALDKYRRTHGVVSWFPESRDEWVRERFGEICDLPY